MATLSLPTSPSCAVWKLIKAQLKADPTLTAASIRLIFFDNTEATKDLTDYQGPVLRFYPSLGRMAWFTESSQSGGLIVNYEALVPAIDDEDVLNIQSAIQQALYPNDAFAFGQTLIDAGAVTGMPLFQQPLTSPMSVAGVSGMMRAMGLFALEIDYPLSP